MTQASSESSGQRILVVDDDPALAEMLQLVLHKERFVTDWCSSGSRALDVFEKFRPDLILLDLMLPGRNGIDVCREVRRVSGVPIIMLTARSDTHDVVTGLEAGADDYVSKPFKSKELVARIRTRLRTPLEVPDTDVMSIGALTIDVRAHQVSRGGQEIALTPLEFDLLVALARRPHDVFSRDALLQEVWGYRHAADTRLVNVHVQRLRSKVEEDPEHPSIIITVRGVGYRAGSGEKDEN